MAGFPCGNNPHYVMSPGDAAVVAEFRLFLTARAEEKTTVTDLQAAREALRGFLLRPGFVDAVERFEAAVRANERAGAEVRRLGAPDVPTARIDRLRPEFTEHASVKSIDAQTRRAERQRGLWDARVRKLAALREAREAQMEAGTWPAAEESK